MSGWRLEKIQPVKVVYRLSDVFDALTESLEGNQKRALENKDSALLSGFYSATIDDQRKSISLLTGWIGNSVEYLGTEAILSETSPLHYNHAHSLCRQLLDGKLQPVGV